jgi:hypothetical protein
MNVDSFNYCGVTIHRIRKNLVFAAWLDRRIGAFSENLLFHEFTVQWGNDGPDRRFISVTRAD